MESSLQALLTVPEIVWEASLGIYLAFKGFRRDAPILSGDATRAGSVTVPDLAER